MKSFLIIALAAVLGGCMLEAPVMTEDFVSLGYETGVYWTPDRLQEEADRRCAVYERKAVYVVTSQNRHSVFLPMKYAQYACVKEADDEADL